MSDPFFMTLNKVEGNTTHLSSSVEKLSAIVFWRYTTRLERAATIYTPTI
jgi:hypothetical protein